MKEFSEVSTSWTGVNRPSQATLVQNYNLLPPPFQKYLKKTLNLQTGAQENFLPIWIDNAMISASGEIVVPLLFYPLTLAVKETQIFALNTDSDKLVDYSFGKPFFYFLFQKKMPKFFLVSNQVSFGKEEMKSCPHLFGFLQLINTSAREKRKDQQELQ